MNIFKTSLLAAFATTASLALNSCADKTTPVLIEQGERINSELQALVSENPQLFSEAKAQYSDGCMAIDVVLADSLFNVAQITTPLFNYFTAYEIKNHLDKNLETTVNAMSEKEASMAVTLTDVYGDSHTYDLSAATLRRMVKSPLTQLDYNEARTGLFDALAASEAQFLPDEGHVKGFSTSFKGGFFAYTVEFEKQNYYNSLVTANIKARALKVLEQRYSKLGTLKPVLFGMYKSLGIDGFNLIYSADNSTRVLKTSVTLSNLQK